MLFGKFVPDFVRSNLRGCKFKIFLGEHAPRPPPLLGMHAYVCEHAFACYYHPATILLSSCYHPATILLPSCFPPPTQSPVCVCTSATTWRYTCIEVSLSKPWGKRDLTKWLSSSLSQAKPSMWQCVLAHCVWRQDACKQAVQGCYARAVLLCRQAKLVMECRGLAELSFKHMTEKLVRSQAAEILLLRFLYVHIVHSSP